MRGPRGPPPGYRIRHGNLLREGVRPLQGFETTCREAIYHVVEHLSWHTGQIVWIAKLRAGETHGTAFYDDRKLDNPSR